MTGESPRSHERSDGELVLAVQGQNQAAFAELFDRWFDRVFDVARNIVRDDDTAAEVAQDAFLTIWQKMDTLKDPEVFGGWALRIGRNRALNRLKKEQRSKPMEAEVMTGLHDRDSRDDHVGSNRMTDTAEISETRDRQELLWAVSSVLGERDASLMDLTLRHHLSTSEIAIELGTTENNAHQLLFRLRKKLGEAVASYLLWRGGTPRCPDLLAIVRPSDSSTSDIFDAPLSRKVKRHSKTCETCSDERVAAVSPQRLFSSIPIISAPLALKAEAASALALAGVPTSPETDGELGQSPSQAFVRKDEAGRTRAKTRSSATTKKLIVFLASAVALIIGILLLTGSPTPEIEPAAPEIFTSTTRAPSEERLTPGPTLESPAKTRKDPTTTSPTSELPAETTTTLGTTRPTTTTATTTTTTTTTAPPGKPPPLVLRFEVGTPVGLILTCIDPGQIGRRAIWLTENAESVQVVTPGETFNHGPSGEQLFCAAPGSVIELLATGLGGTATASATS